MGVYPDAESISWSCDNVLIAVDSNLELSQFTVLSVECCSLLSVAVVVFATVSCSPLSGIATSGADLGKLSYERMFITEVFTSSDNGVLIACDGLIGLGMTLPRRGGSGSGSE